MKVTETNYAILAAAIRPLMVSIPLKQYTDNGLTAKRWRWDLTYKAGLSQWICDVLYGENDCNDDHIDTALRHITDTR